MRRYIPLFLTFTVGLLAISPASFAQETTATIIGTVTDESAACSRGKRDAAAPRYPARRTFTSCRSSSKKAQWLANPTADGIDNRCTTSTTSGTISTDRFGQVLNARAAREIQLGLKLDW